MKLKHRIAHVLRKPPRVIAWKLAHRALRQARRFHYWSRLAASSRARLRAIPVAELRKHLREAPQLLLARNVDASADAIRRDFPAEADALIAAADRILALEFSYLGWTRRFDGLPLPWHTDWNTGRVWEPRYYADYDYSEPHRPSDVKSSWEPSRFHFGVQLGQGYRLTGDARYREHFFLLLRDWLAANPLAGSINWTSPLEVGIRGANLAAALALFADADEADLRLLVEAIAEHGGFLVRNVEYTDVRGNHFTGNLFGLLAMGLLLEGLFPEARRWRTYAEQHIRSEILLQYHPDGVNFEKSVPYHRFVTEMFLLSGILLARAGRPLEAPQLERLRAAIAFTRAYIRPDGRVPIIGDNDDARALPLAAEPVARHDHLLTTAGLLFGDADDVAADGAWAEALWVGGARPPVCGAGQRRESRAFPAGGFYVGRHGRHHLIIDAGHVGLQSGGCHGHHDMLAFELSLDGVPLIVDAGSPAYTGDVATKNRFRRTAAHNTARVDGMEQGAFDPTRIWHLGAEARAVDVTFEADASRTVFAGAHAGYERLPEPVTHRRRLELTAEGRLAGVDEFAGSGRHDVELFFQFHQDVRVQLDERQALIVAGERQWRLSWTSADADASLDAGEVSPSYGVRLPAPRLRMQFSGALPWSFHYCMERT